MTFVFQCPQGHSLEGNECDVGRPARCPACGQLIEVPSPATGREMAAPSAATTPRISVEPTIKAAPEFFHIPCPNGHELESPPDWINQPVRCPECGAEFVLRKEQSTEFQAEAESRRAARAARADKIWVRVAIAAGVSVLLGIGLMIALSH